MWYQSIKDPVNLNGFGILKRQKNYIKGEYRSGETNSRLRTVTLFRGETEEEAIIEEARIFTHLANGTIVDPQLAATKSALAAEIQNPVSDEEVVVEEDLPAIDPTHKRAYDMREEGETYVAIAKELGVSESAVRNWVNDVNERLTSTNEVLGSQGEEQDVSERRT